MFTKSKISQSMLDAVNSVINEEDKKLLLEPGKSTKLPMPTGTKVLGHRYGNSAKAHKDQTSHEIDKVKEPSNKELAKESFEDEHGISDKAFKSKLVNKAKKSMKEGKGNGPQETFTDNNMGEEISKSDVPAYLRKQKGEKPLTVADVKSPKKSTISHPENLAKARNEDYGQIDEISIETMKSAKQKLADRSVDAHMDDNKRAARDYAGRALSMSSKIKKKERLKSKEAKLEEGKKMALGAYYGKQNEESEVTTDMIKGRESGGKSNSFKGYKVTLKDGEKIEVPPSEETGEDTPARNSIKAKLSTTISQMHKEEAILDEMINEVMAKDASAGDWIKDFTDSENPKFAGKSKKKRKEMALAAYYSKKNEEDELDEAVSRKDFQMVADLIKTHDDHGKRKELAQHHAEIFHRQNPRFDRSKFMKAANVTEETVSEGRMKDIATDKEEDERLGTWKKETPWKDSKETITDKSGAKHTPMSRAKDLARSAFKKLQKETMMGKISN